MQKETKELTKGKLSQQNLFYAKGRDELPKVRGRLTKGKRMKKANNTYKRQTKKRYFGKPVGSITQEFSTNDVLNWGNRIIPIENLFMLLRKTYMWFVHVRWLNAQS